MEHKLTLIPEWEEQDLILLSWPHLETDWARILPEVEQTYLQIAERILQYEDLLILTPEPSRIEALFAGKSYKHCLFVHEMDSNDTWARDYAPLSFRLIDAEGKEHKLITDFTFNGWGMKFAADKDNLMTRCLYLGRAFAREVKMLNRRLLVLEGGGVESDGKGTILTTSSCIFEPNRNAGFEADALKDALRESLGADRLILLDNGDLEGDDTDGHIDTLARFLSPRQIAYVQCTDPADIHYHPLKRMEAELQALRTSEGKPYELIPLPLPQAIYEEDGHRLPATYANFLFVNGAVIVPTYAQPELDALAIDRLQQAMPEREVVGVDCRALIRQHGSLHCATMQFPLGFINKNKWQ